MECRYTHGWSLLAHLSRSPQRISRFADKTYESLVALHLLFSTATSFFSQPAGRKRTFHQPCLCTTGGVRKRRLPPACTRRLHDRLGVLHNNNELQHLATDLKERHN